MQRVLNRRKRSVSGASIHSRRKNGRRRRSSSVSSSSMSVRTQCSCHRLVTNSRRLSTSGKVRPLVPLSSVTEGRNLLPSSSGCWLLADPLYLVGRCSLRKPWFCTRYSAVVCLPAQIVPQTPISIFELVIEDSTTVPIYLGQPAVHNHQTTSRALDLTE